MREMLYEKFYQMSFWPFIDRMKDLKFEAFTAQLNDLFAC